MANNQDLEMNGEDFSQDVRAGEDDQMNGDNSDHNGHNASAEAPGRDDDR